MNVRVVAALGGENVVIVGGVCRALADVHRLAVDPGNGGSIDEAVDERRVRVLEDLLDAA